MTANSRPTAQNPRTRARRPQPDSKPVPSPETRQDANGALREAVLKLLEATSRAANTPEVQKLRDEVRALCGQR